jgi:DNA invertase Pin-like site-specific DNA recombinase
MKIGYSRVSTSEQTLMPQDDLLLVEGCEKIFSDVASGANTERVHLHQALEYIRSGDTLVVVKLDRLGRSLKHLIEVVSGLEARGIGFKSLTEGIDTTTSGGRLVFHIFGAIAEFERDLIRERTQAGLKAARARGRMGGRPRKMTPEKIQQAKALGADHQITVGQICETLGISRDTYYRYVKF